MIILRQETYWTLFVCTITHTFVHVFSFMHLALMPVFMSEFGLSIFELGLLASIPLAISILISIPYGFLTDRIGPRNLIAASLLLSGFSGLALTQAGDLVTLLLSLILIPLSSTLYHPPTLAVVSELFPPNQRNRVLGIHGAGGTSGVAIGPISLGIVMGTLGWRFAYVMWVIPILVSTLFLLKLPKATKTTYHNPEEAGGSEILKENKGPRTPRFGYLVLLIAMSINGIGGQSVSTYMTSYLVSHRGFAESMASLVYGLNSFVGILGSVSGGYLAERFGGKRWMTIAYVAGLFVLTGVWLGPMWFLILIYLSGGFFGASTMGPSSSLVAEFSPRERRGLAYTMFMVSFSLMGAVSPLIAAKIIELYEIQALFPFAIVFSLVSTSLLQLMPQTRRSDRHDFPPTESPKQITGTHFCVSARKS